MPLNETEAQALGASEEELWQNVHTAILKEMRQTRSDFETDRRTARDLTSQIVASRRDEDKAALASDEAVASSCLPSALKQPINPLLGRSPQIGRGLASALSTPGMT